MSRRVTPETLSVAARSVSIVAAVANVSVLAYFGGARLSWLTALAALYGYACGRWLRPALAATLALIVPSPALLFLVNGIFHQREHALWLAMLLGAALSVPRGDWSLPALLKLPAAAWTVTIALAAVIVLPRETDFTTLTLTRAGVSAPGAPPVLLVQWIALVAAGMLVAVLWLDYLFAVYAGAPFRRFALEVLLPLGASVAVSGLVGLYQTFVDSSLLRPGFWRVLGRATGTVRDANGFGALCALWGAPVAALGIWRVRGVLGASLAAFALALSWAGVWVSGSRGALLLALAGTLAWLLALAAGLKRTVAALVVVVAIAAGAVAIRVGSESGPVQRLSVFVYRAIASPRVGFEDIWERDGYGVVANRATRDHPGAGLGIGLFHSAVRDYSPPTPRGRLPPDNAQNWYRHQLAEFGVLGSVGWILWVGVVVYLLATARRLPDRRDVTVVKWVVIAFGLVSLVSMPGQELFVGLTFVTLLFWFLSGIQMPESRLARVLDGVTAWGVIWIVVLAFGAVTAIQAVTTMRPPVRAARHDRDYMYGFRTDRDTLHWAGRHAVITLRAPTGRMKLTYWVNHPDTNERRVGVEIWRDGESIARRDLRRGERVTEFVPVPGGGRRFVLEVKVDRTFRPVDYGGTDRRELGLAMTWEFMDAPRADGS